MRKKRKMRANAVLHTGVCMYVSQRHPVSSPLIRRAAIRCEFRCGSQRIFLPLYTLNDEVCVDMCHAHSRGPGGGADAQRGLRSQCHAQKFGTRRVSGERCAGARVVRSSWSLVYYPNETDRCPRL